MPWSPEDWDADQPGVLEFGARAGEISQTLDALCVRVAGIVSKFPPYGRSFANLDIKETVLRACAQGLVVGLICMGRGHVQAIWQG